MSGRLEGKRTLITGAGSGLGRGSAMRFAEQGAAVACVDRDFAAAESVAKEINGAGGRALPIEVDVSDEASVAESFAQTTEAFGGVDVIYANAGIPGVGTGADTTIELWDRVIAVMLTGVFLTDKYALRQMLAQGTGGSIINQASVGGIIGVAGIAPYAAAKAGVIGLTRQLACDYGPESIRVNAICPGTVPTPLVRQSYAERGGYGVNTGESVEETLAMQARLRFPLGRLGREIDIADAAVFLASDESTWITGVALPVDGGQTAI